jgi:methenyltetrahydromethanopterin cyclohydrolase
MRACSVRSARICIAIALLSLEGSSSPLEVQARLVDDNIYNMLDVHYYDSADLKRVLVSST